MAGKNSVRLSRAGQKDPLALASESAFRCWSFVSPNKLTISVVGVRGEIGGRPPAPVVVQAVDLAHVRRRLERLSENHADEVVGPLTGFPPANKLVCLHDGPCEQGSGDEE